MGSSRIIKVLDDTEISIIKNELVACSLEWLPHYKQFDFKEAPLRHGTSIYLHAVHVLNRTIIEDHRHLFFKTIELLARLTGNSKDKLARSYWHRLRPGERIDVHRDMDSGGSRYFDSIKRFQVFLNLDRNFVIVMDSKLWNYSPNAELSNSLIAFNFSDWHYYANHSDMEITFLVMDFYK